MAQHLFDRRDLAPIASIALLPLVLAIPQVAGWIASDPLLYTAQTSQVVERLLPGTPAIDPNNGFTTQALGRRAALEWLSGNVPWWNYFTGVGLPLAAEYQPAALSPLTLLLFLPAGMAWHQAVLQIIAGLGTYGLLRQLGLARLAAATGGLLFAFNGTLAWFAHGPATAVPWIPWMLWGVERAYVHTVASASGGWRLFAVALAMSLLAGFPETAYIGGLLALAWAIVRCFSLPRERRLAFIARIVPSGLAGLAISAPQTLSFFHYLQHAEIGEHADMSRSGYPWISLVPSLIAPYYWGPVFGHVGEWDGLLQLWGGIGGYVTAAIVVVAVYGLMTARSAINWMLAAWIVLVLGKSFLVEPALFLWNLVPGVTSAAFARYAQPTWELALIVLAACGLDQAIGRAPTSRWPAIGAAAAWLVAALVLAITTWTLWPVFPAGGALRDWSAGSAVAALAISGIAVALVASRARLPASRALAALLVAEAVAMYALPLLSSPVRTQPGLPAIEFLRANIGLHRFFTLGPIQPNYGAYFGIASINHNYLPVAGRWVDFVRARLDAAADPIVFNGNFARPAGAPTPASELRRNLAEYEWVGVRYVVAYTAHEPPLPPGLARRAYADEWMTIYELASPKPYFEVVGGKCELGAHDRARATLVCSEPSALLRRELYFPGWSARVNGAEAPIAERGKLFQEVALPAGNVEVRFDYAPPHIGWAWLLAAMGLTALIGRKPTGWRSGS